MPADIAAAKPHPVPNAPTESEVRSTGPETVTIPETGAITDQQAPMQRRVPDDPAGQNVLIARLRGWYSGGLVRDVALSLLSLIVGLGIWHVLTINDMKLIANFRHVPEPLMVWDSFTRNIVDPVFQKHVLVSVERVMKAFALASLVGIVLGLLMGRIRPIRAWVMPHVEILRPIPAVAWIPLAILMWPTEEASIMHITFLGAVFPIILNAMHGAEQTPEVLVRAVRSLGASRLAVFRHVVLPAALPSIAAGLAIGMGVAWFSLLAGEIISGQYGIGYFTWDAYSMIRTPDIVVGMLVIGVLGSASTYGVRLLCSPFLRWRARSH